MYHQNQGAGNMWSSLNGDVAQSSSLQFSGHFSSQHKTLFYRDPNKLLTSVSPDIPHFFFNSYQQDKSSGVTDVHSELSQQIPLHHCPSISSNTKGKLIDCNGYSRWPFPAWANIKTRHETVLQNPEENLRSSFCRGQSPRLGESSGKDPCLIKSQLDKLDKSSGEGDRAKTMLGGVCGSIEQNAMGKINKSNSTNMSLDSSDGPSAFVLGSVQTGSQIPGKYPTSLQFGKKTGKINSNKKRQRVEERWIKNIRKNARSKGESYTSVRGKVVPARSVKPVDCSKCKFNCPLRVSEEERWQLHRHYWTLESYKEKVNYLCSLIHEFSPLRPISGKKSYSRRFMLKIKQKDERVCKDFFISTFDISQSTVKTFMAKRRKGPDAVADLRGKQKSSNKMPDSVVRLLREHALSQIGPKGGLLQLSPGDQVQNVQKLYNHYLAECEADNTKPASISQYRRVVAEIYKGKSSAVLFELPEEQDLPSSCKKKQKLPVSNIQSDSILSGAANSKGFHNSHPKERNIQGVDTLSDKEDSVFSPLSSEPNLCSSPYAASCLSAPVLLNSSTQNANYMRSLETIRQHIGNLKQGVCSQTVYTDLYQKESHLPYSTSDTQNSNRNLCSTSCTKSDSSGNFISKHIVAPCAQMPLQVQSAKQSAFLSHFSSPLDSLLQDTSRMKKCITSQSEQVESISREKIFSEMTGKRMGKGSTKDRNKEKKRSQKQTSKRIRNEESWAKNVRKRLRMKGESYTSVRGKKVGAKTVKKVDCSKCMFMCSTKISEGQRLLLNKHYWDLDAYEKKIRFLAKHVETYTPKRQTTGRKAFSRKYSFQIDGVIVRVCKDFFQSTLHISESTIATALEKTRHGLDSLADMRGRHRPCNKTPEETLQNIRELIIYLTGFRPHKPANNRTLKLRPEFCDVSHLYLIYRYECEKKGQKAASIGVFRGVLTKDFCIKNWMLKKNSEEKNDAPHETSGSSCSMSLVSSVFNNNIDESKVGIKSIVNSVPSFLPV
ncbi:WS0399_0 protein [Elysia marginata]|uniref:WS0399_0 protein n=1 Tax=Elysia marginata TaxID=1093978 RepID=A0AAV4JHA0_9GAST|nr:WS0399_0 protein [Elysia marginata]